jgi:ABC-type sugar transport system ATPase subunit
MPSGGQATLGIRPEDIALVAPDAPGAIPARVTVSELAGPERFHFVSMGGGSVIVRTPASTVLHPGETVALGLQPDRLHLFQGAGEDAAALR